MSEAEIRKQLEPLAQAVSVPVEQVVEVYTSLAREHTLPSETLLAELRWFYADLGLGDHYFRTTPRLLIAHHVQSLYAAKILARAGGDRLNLRHEVESDDIAIYATRDEHAIAAQIERRIERKFPHHRLQSYHSTGSTEPDDPSSQLRLYFVVPPHFDDAPVDEGESRIERLGAPALLGSITGATRERYQRALAGAVKNLGVVIDMYERRELGTIQIVLGLQRGSAHGYFSAVSDVLNNYGLRSKRKYIEPFKNGVVVYSIHIDAPVDQEVLDQIREDLSLVYVLPRTAFTPLFREGRVSAQEYAYLYVVWKFAHQFLFRYSREYQLLAPAFASDPELLGLLHQFKLRLNKDTFTESRIFEAIVKHLPLVKALYADFARYHFTAPNHLTAPYDPDHGADLQQRFDKETSSETDRQILSAFLCFNRHLLKTNFYRDSKIALAFRLDPTFLPQSEYRVQPFAVFFMLGSEFRGFHVRFSDVARGGIRIIRSTSPQAHSRNNAFLFDEVYQLANTQHSKNKDIPEGGSKGAILLAIEHQDRSRVAFAKYIDSLLDVLLPNEEIADHYGKEEILFLGPDEGTADLMDWAALRARSRGYRFWKSFTTGKSVRWGGIPHDQYGMTTRSVHQYVLGILRELGLEETNITKIQTGGPDGDLGSNEIKISNDRTVAIIDGSGVAYDPHGLNRAELLRLAQTRQPICNFERSRLRDGGFIVTTDERDVQLPDGTAVESGLRLRDTFHLGPLARADLFVPCGGRPESVNINNVSHLLDASSKPRFRFVVEGANLFFTQPARRALEQAGVILFKDASANKGGVTSSSLEVLAALALTDTEFEQHMTVHGRQPPQLYQRFVTQVQARIEHDATLEFECIWREHRRTGRLYCELTDELGSKINRLGDQIRHSSLAQRRSLRCHVLSETCPAVLLERVGLDTLLERLPDAYLEAMVGAHLASRYVYRYGVDASEVDFVDLISTYLSDSELAAQG